MKAKRMSDGWAGKRCQDRMALPTVSNIRTFRAMLILSIFGAA